VAPSKKTKMKAPRKRGWNYPRRGLGPIHRWLPSWRFVLAALSAVFALGIAAFATLYATTKVPDPSEFALAQATTVYYSDGKTPLGTFADYDRKPVDLDTLPDYVAHAVVASEDQSFYTNNGISLPSIARAFMNNIRGGSRQGGSTLTQQYVERYFLGTTTSFTGKIHEALIALKIDRQQSKDEILQNYLNTIYFGRGAYGIEVASQKYFGISSSDLTLSQAALLVAVIPAPSAWDPAVDADMAQARWQRVIDNMVSLGYLTSDEADQQKFPDTIDPTIANSFAGTNGYLLQEVSSELIASGKFTEDDLNQNGYTIVTTIDKDKQQAAVDAVNSLPSDRPDNNYVGLISADPRTGAIYAMYGGKDYLTRQRSNATQDQAQGGSTFKTFGLLAALENGKTLADTYRSISPITIGDTEITNSDSISHGIISIFQATKYSDNTVYAQMNEDIGPAKTEEAAIQAGLPEDTPGLDDSLTNVLGSASVTAAQMAKVFGMYANGGVEHDLYIVDKVTNSEGVQVYTGANSGKRVFSENVINTLSYALQAPTSAGGTAEKASELGRPVRGKTGTSSGPYSAWFIGYIPQMVTAVDMYQIGPNGEQQILSNFGGISPWIAGGDFPTDVWLSYMKAATADMDVEDFPDPDSELVSGASYSPTVEPSVSATPSATPSALPTQEPTTEAPAPATTTKTPEQQEETSEPAVEPTSAPTTTESGDDGTESGSDSNGNGAAGSDTQGDTSAKGG
jgi:membrane peptidoglycan carboxypeptidase